MKYLWRLIFILAALIAYIGYSHPDWIVDPPFIKVSAATCVGNPDGKCEFNPQGALDKDPTPPDPNRPSFDQCGNEYDYQGNLISPGTGCQPAISQTPVSVTQPPAIAQSDTFKGK